MNTEIVEAIESRISDARVEVELDGNRALITVTSEIFEPLSRVQKQQKVYDCITHLLQDGRLHAVTIRTLAPD